MTEFDPFFQTVAEISLALSQRRTTSVSLTEQIFERLGHIDPKLNAFVRLTRGRALAEAGASDARTERRQRRGQLDGVPYVVKDLMDVAGEPTLAGSGLLAGHVAQEDAHAVQNLARAGMVLIGKTQTVAFAAHIDGINREFGTPHNPWRREPHLPGGSSSGSAVAVAAGLVPVALGTDTGGSIRVPAALNGITGFKPTIGRIGRGGVRPLCWSLDTVGPLARTASDTAMVFDALQGHDPRDEATWGIASVNPQATCTEGLEGLHIAICETLFFEEAQPQVIAAVEIAGEILATLGATVTRRRMPEVAEAMHLHESEVFSSEAFAVNRALIETDREAMDPAGMWMDTADRFLATEYYAAQRRRYDIQRRFAANMGKVHAILTPTCAQVAWPLAKLDAGNRPPVRYSRNTTVGNLLNMASISIPCGIDQNGLPIGAMLSARPFDDQQVLRIAEQFQRVTRYHSDQPDLSWIKSGHQLNCKKRV